MTYMLIGSSRYNAALAAAVTCAKIAAPTTRNTPIFYREFFLFLVRTRASLRFLPLSCCRTNRSELARQSGWTTPIRFALAWLELVVGWSAFFALGARPTRYR